MNVRRLASIAGIATPVSFAFVVMIAALWVPDYEHSRHAISSLAVSGSESGWFVNVFGFGLSGVFLCAFGVSFVLVGETGVSSILATLSWGAVGCGLLMAGMWQYPHPYHSEAVFYASLFSASGVLFGTFAIGAYSRSPILWLAAAIGVLAVLSYIGLLSFGYEKFGTLQRIHIGGVGVWVGLAGLHFLALESA